MKLYSYVFFCFYEAAAVLNKKTAREAAIIYVSLLEVILILPFLSLLLRELNIYNRLTFSLSALCFAYLTHFATSQILNKRENVKMAQAHAAMASRNKGLIVSSSILLILLVVLCITALLLKWLP